MFKKIAIVGAGQSGLQLGFELLAKGYDVTLYSEKTPEAVLNSPPLPVPIQFTPSVTFEEQLKLDFWRKYPATNIDGVRFDLYTPEGIKAFTIESPLKIKAQTVDLRLKYSVWLQEFEKRGGKLIIQEGNIDLLEELALSHDAVFVATGKGSMANMFEVDKTKTLFDKPMRNLALFYAKDCELNYLNDPTNGGSSYNIMQGVGELIMSPFLSKDKERIHYILFEVLPGGPLDIFDKNADPSAALEKAKAFLKEKYPPLYEMIKKSSLVNNEWISGSITPTVKKPAAKLPSGKFVMAIGDLLILNDPVLAQGLNGASKLAHFLAETIHKNNKAVFNEEWINRTFEAYWETAKYNNLMTASMLEGPQPYQQLLLFSASQNKDIAAIFVNGIGNACSMYPWFGDPEEAMKFLKSHNVSIPV